MSDAKTASPEAAAGLAKSGGSKMMPLILGFNSLLVVGVIAFMALQMNKGHSSAKEEPAAAVRGEDGEEGHGESKGEGKEGAGGGTRGGVMVKLSDFVVHLRNPEIDRYVRMSFDLEVNSESDKDMVNNNLPKVRDAFISYLSDRTMEEMRGSEGLIRTKEALNTKLREALPDVRVRGLYISDFVVQ